jgi:hypothetical protein
MNDIVTNEFGGKQSHIGGRYDLIPPHALKTVAYVLAEGAKKYSEFNWKRITTNEHINHALNHINLHFIGDEDENHLGHAIVRLMMAYEVDQLGVQIDASPAKLEEAAKRYKDLTNQQPSFEESYNQILQWSP